MLFITLRCEAPRVINGIPTNTEFKPSYSMGVGTTYQPVVRLIDPDTSKDPLTGSCVLFIGDTSSVYSGRV